MRKLNFQVSYLRKVPNPSAIQKEHIFSSQKFCDSFSVSLFSFKRCKTRMTHLKLLIYFFSKEEDDTENNLGPFEANFFCFNGWNCLESGGERFREQFCNLKNYLVNSGQPLGFLASVAELLKFATLEVHAVVAGLTIQLRNQACCSHEYFYQQLGILLYKGSSVVPLFCNYSAKLQLISHLWSKAWSVQLQLSPVFNQLDLHYSSQWRQMLYKRLLMLALLLTRKGDLRIADFKKPLEHYEKSVFNLSLLAVHWIMLHYNNCSCINRKWN